MGEVIKFPEGGKQEQRSEIDKLGDLVRFISDTPHSHNKMDGLSDFERRAQELIASGRYQSEKDILAALEERGVEHASAIIKLAKAVRGE